MATEVDWQLHSLRQFCLSYKLKYLHFILEMQIPFLRDLPSTSASSICPMANNAKQIGYSNPQTPQEQELEAGGRTRSLSKKGRFVGVTIYAFGLPERWMHFAIFMACPRNSFSTPFLPLAATATHLAEVLQRQLSGFRSCSNKKAIKITFYGPDLKEQLGVWALGGFWGRCKPMTSLMQTTDGVDLDEIVPPGSSSQCQAASLDLQAELYGKKNSFINCQKYIFSK